MEQGTTQNPTEQVLELCAAIQSGQTSRWGELSPLVTRRHQEMNRSFSSFLKAIESEGRAFEQKLEEPISIVEDFFAAYDEALKQIADSVPSRNLVGLSEGVQELRRSALGLRLAMQNYDESFLALGPNRFPMVNFLTNLAQRIGEGAQSQPQWAKAIQGYLDLYRVSLAEVEKSDHRNKPGMADRLKAFQDLVSLLESLQPTSDLAPLEGILAGLESAVEVYNASEIASKPTSSPRANIIIHAAWAVHEGRLPAAVLKGLSTTYLGMIQEAQSTISERDLQDPGLVGEEAAKMLKSLELIEDVVMLLQAFADGKATTRDDLEQALKCLSAEIENAARSSRSVEDFMENAGKILCPHCQAPNPRERRNCENCLGALPQNVGESTATNFAIKEGDLRGSESYEPVMTETMLAFLETCDRFGLGKVSVKEFEALLNHTEGTFELAEGRVATLTPPPETPSDIPESRRAFADSCQEISAATLESFHEGVAQCRQALELFRSCLDKPQPARMAPVGDGILIYFAGCQKLIRIGYLFDRFVTLVKEDNAELEAATQAAAEADADGTSEPEGQLA